MHLHLADRNFCLFLLTQFPFATDDISETTLTDYLYENFAMPPNEWWNELTSGTQEPWNGYTYVHPLNDAVTLYAEFHPNETVYFFNEIYLGNTGGHVHLSLLSWNELKAIVNRDETDPALLFFLMLPLTIGNKSEQPEIEATIARYLKKTVLDLNAAQIASITSFLSSHLIFDEEEQNTFEHINNIGLVVNRNHSERNRKHSEEDLTRINTVINSII